MSDPNAEPIVVTASGARILRAGRIPLVDRGRGIRTTPLVGADIGADGLTTGYTTIPAGLAIPWHTHDADESIVMMDGEGLCELADGSYRIGRADATLIPAGVAHRIRNDSDQELRILWIYPSSTVVRRLIDEDRVLGHLDPYGEA
jgi:quercetin dioxygenase-like cupin family protein